jgi:fucose permease
LWAVVLRDLIKPILDNQLHWSNEQFGAVNSAFQGAYALGGLIFGWLVDRLGSKIGYARRLHHYIPHLRLCLSGGVRA